MANLFGTGINQIPTNGMLGNLAFQDKAYVSVDAIGIGTTFVDSGTAGQPLQVSGGAYVSGSIGIGTTNPTSKLTVVGDTNITGITTTSILNVGTGGTVITTTSGGLVGIGITIPSQTGNTSKVHISEGNLKLDENNQLTWDGTFPSYINGSSGPYGNIQFNAGNNKILQYTSNTVSSNISDFSPTLTQTIDLGRSSLQYRNTWIGGNLFVGTASSTGTANQALQIGTATTAFGAYISGSVGIGTTNPISKLTVVGDVLVSGVVTATSFSGNVSVSGYASTAGIATNLKGGAGGSIPYQSAADTTAFLANGTGGYILQSNGGTSAPSWVPAAPAGAITGLTIRDEGTIVGDANSVSQLNFVGNIVSVASTAGIATITFLDYVSNSGIATYATSSGVSTSVIGGIGSITQLQVTGVSTFTNGPVLIGGGTSTGTAGQVLQVTGINSSVYIGGNLGIGTTNPTSKLTVNGAIQIQQDSGSNNRFILRGQPSSSYRWNIDNFGSANDFRIFREDDVTSANGVSVVSISTIGTLSATKFSGDGSLLTNLPSASSQWVTTSVGIHTLSNVGIGTTNPTSKLTVSGNASITGILTADQVYTSNNGGGQNIRIGDDLWVGDVNVSNTTRFSGVQDSTKAFIIFGTSDAVALGRTGTGPLYYGGDFTISGVSTANSFRARGGAPGGLGVNNNGYGFFSPGDNDSGMYSSADGQIEFYTNSTEAVRINSSQNVGIGTTIPTSKLHVIGDALVSGVVTSTTFIGNLTGTASSIAGGLAGNILYQSAPNTTAFLANGTQGYVLQTNGVGNAPTWVPAALSGAVTGLVIRDSSNNIVGTSGSVTQLTFSTGLSVTGTTGAAGIATITLSSNIVGTALSISGISTLGITSATNLTAQQLNVSGISTFQSSNLKIVGASTSFQYSIVGSTIIADRNLTIPLLSASDTFAFLGATQTFSGSVTFNNALTATGIVNLTGSTTGTSVFGTSQTSATLTFGGTSGTGLITFGRSTVTQQTNIQAGASGVGTTKTINLGTGGLSGSFTQINIGPTSGVGTVSINSGTNLGIGSTNPTTAISIAGTTGISFADTNIRIGDATTGSSITSGINNFFGGASAGRFTTTGSNNNFFGIFAGRSNTTGTYNNFFGQSAGYGNTTGRHNNFLGYQAGYYNTSGGCNNFFGCQAGRSNITGIHNNFIGHQAGYCNTTGGCNNFLGYFAGRYNTTGTSNNFFGQSAGYANTTGTSNNFFGGYAGRFNTTGCNNNFFGPFAGYCNTTGSYNNFFGFQAGCTNVTGSQNVVIGYNQQTPITSGDNQLVIGAGSTSWIVGNSSYNVGFGITNPTQKLQVQGNISINGTVSYGSTVSTSSTTSQIGIHSGLSTSTYRSVEYTIQATQGTNYHATKILSIHNGTIAYNSEYGTIYNNTTVGVFDVDVSGGNMRLLVTPSSASTTNYNINFVATVI